MFFFSEFQDIRSSYIPAISTNVQTCVLPNKEMGLMFCPVIVNRRNWLWSPANIKGANKDTKIFVGRSTTLHNLLYCTHTLCMDYVTNTFLLVRSSVWSKQLLCFVQGQGQKTEQKHTTKNFDEFHNHSPLLTMVQCPPPLYFAAPPPFLLVVSWLQIASMDTIYELT